MKKIVIDNTIYSIFVYILLDKEWRESVYILNTQTFNTDFIIRFQNKIKKIHIFKKYEIKKHYFGYILEKLKVIIFILKIFLEEKNIVMYGNDNLEYFFSINKNIFLIEDGLINYKKLSNIFLKERIKKAIILKNPFYKPYGYSQKVKKIYLTGLAPIPKEIESKVEIINLKELWNKKAEEEKKEILDIFGFDENLINKIKNKKNILFTQPLSEDGFISEEEKMELYKKIVSNYLQKDLVIKTHPREKTDYKKYFPEIEILNQSFPAELFDLLDIKFEKVITIFSTAALGFSKDSEVDFYGTRVHPKLLKLWGDSEKIMRANKIL